MSTADLASAVDEAKDTFIDNIPENLVPNDVGVSAPENAITVSTYNEETAEPVATAAMKYDQELSTEDLQTVTAAFCASFSHTTGLASSTLKCRVSAGRRRRRLHQIESGFTYYVEVLASPVETSQPTVRPATLDDLFFSAACATPLIGFLLQLALLRLM